MADSKRIKQVSSLLQSEVAKYIQIELPRLGLVTVTHVGLAKDFSTAKVFVSFFPEESAKEKIVSLNKHSKMIRYSLSQIIQLRQVPQLFFVYDDSAVKGFHIASLLKEVD